MTNTPPKISLKAARVNAGLNLEEAAKRIGVSRATLHNWERDSSNVRVSDLEVIERAYRYPVDYIFFGNSLELKSS